MRLNRGGTRSRWQRMWHAPATYAAHYGYLRPFNGRWIATELALRVVVDTLR